MPYTIGTRKINLTRTLTDSEKQLVLAHPRVFRYCLNDAVFKFLINLKKIVHLYSDILTIYSTLLKKVQHFDDVTTMTGKCKSKVLRLENDFNDIFGRDTLDEMILDSSKRNHHDDDVDVDDGDRRRRRRRRRSTANMELIVKFKSWREQDYETGIKPSAELLLKSSISIFEQVNKTLLCVELFFTSFTNLKKLLIPFLREQTTTLLNSFRLINHLLQTPIFSGNDFQSDQGFTPELYRQLKETERVTSGVERESTCLSTAFVTFDSSLTQYTSILLGKAILKRNIEHRSCELIKRRDVCCQASERVVSIPLTEDKSSLNSAMSNLGKKLFYVVMALMVLVVFVIYRILTLLFGSGR
ncbi:uncharacterized protein LODBEIA_P23240 [Lodderomyces beijingensis]|uniref:Uncharacterized protein n=1 Tax=Lodderomyces beijingensis TaxID=1775926 RepID=A0ABP0ZPF4_9ASCO